MPFNHPIHIRWNLPSVPTNNIKSHISYQYQHNLTDLPAGASLVRQLPTIQAQVPQYRTQGF
jgi:hypothetical protein